MYFATYQHNNIIKLGLVDKNNNSIISFEDIFSKLEIPLSVPNNMNDFIQIANDKLIKDISKLNMNLLNSISIDSVKLMAPIPYPKRNIICLGKNYADHAKEVKSIPSSIDEIPKFPIYFSKSAYPAIGDNDIILNQINITQQLDYEVELVIIIGKKGKNIDPKNAEDYIFGYTIGNDISVRNIQIKHIQWYKGKSMDTHCPIGPYIAHKSIISSPGDLSIQSKVNGELRQNSNTQNLIFDIPYIISDLSKGMTLIPGDIIMTGTPAGVGMGFTPPKFLNPGDKIECTIENIGTLTNFVEK